MRTFQIRQTRGVDGAVRYLQFTPLLRPGMPMGPLWRYSIFVTILSALGIWGGRKESRYLATGQCINKGSYDCNEALVLQADSAPDCQVLCSSFELCLIFAYEKQTEVCALCQGPGGRRPSEAATWGPPVCTGLPDPKSRLPESCFMEVVLSLKTRSRFPSLAATRPQACQTLCRASPDCSYAAFNGVKCWLVPRSFSLSQVFQEAVFGRGVGGVLLPPDCLPNASSETDCVRSGEAFVPLHGAPGALTSKPATTLAECAREFEQADSNVSAGFTYWPIVNLCVIASGVGEDNMLHTLRAGPFSTARTWVGKKCAAKDLTDLAVCTQEETVRNCSGFVYSGVASLEECSLVCRDLAVCRRLIFEPGKSICRICWGTEDNDVPVPVPTRGLTITRACLVGNLGSSGALTTLQKQGLPINCAIPYELFYRWPPLATLPRRSPLECQASCERHGDCLLASFTGSRCLLHALPTNPVGLVPRHSAEVLSIAPFCHAGVIEELRKSPCWKVSDESNTVELSVRSLLDIHTTTAHTPDACLKWAQNQNLQRFRPYNTVYYWIPQRLCALSWDVLPDKPQTRQATETSASYPGLIVSKIACAQGSSSLTWFIGVTVAFAVFFVSIMVGWFVYNCLKEKKRRKAEKKLADSLDASAWDNQKQVCFSFSQAGTKHNLDKAVSETSDSDSDKYHKKGSVTSRDSSQSLDSPISSQSCLGDDESQFFAFQMDDSKPSEGASPKKHKEKSEWRRG